MKVRSSDFSSLAIAVFFGLRLAVTSAYSQFTLTPVPGLPDVASGSVAWADYDNDSRRDFLLSGSFTLSLWRNTASGFTNVTATVMPDLPGIYDGTVAWGDFDNDGLLDLLVTGQTNAFSSSAIAQVWRNTGTAFTNVPISGLPGVAQSAAAWTDFDSDGRLDFLVTGSTNGSSSGALSQLWRNTGPGFTHVHIPGLPGVYFGSLALGDFDNDARPDFLITGITNGTENDATSQLWRNTGNGFTNVPVSGLRGVFVSSVAWGDYDNDGRLDFLITGLANGATQVSQVWRNTGSGFTNVPIPSLPGNFDNSLAWGDYDNDSRLDFLIAGTSAGGNVSQLWRNTAVSSNTPSSAPANLSSIVSGTTVVLNWNSPADDRTPTTGLSYNVRIGTTPGGSDIASAPTLTNGMLRLPRMGTARNNSTAFHSLTPGQTYYWSVQAVDTSFAGSPFAAEQQFSTSPLLISSVRHDNGVFEFSFTSTPGATFTVLAATNPSLPLNNWTVLGATEEVSPGRFRFIDPQAPNNPQRYYRVRAP